MVQTFWLIKAIAQLKVSEWVLFITALVRNQSSAFSFFMCLGLIQHVLVCESKCACMFMWISGYEIRILCWILTHHLSQIKVLKDLLWIQKHNQPLSNVSRSEISALFYSIHCSIYFNNYTYFRVKLDIKKYKIFQHDFIH